MDIRQFILTRDRAESRRIRRSVAESGHGFNVQVGTWPELVQTALDAYSLSPPEFDWKEQLTATLPQRENSFWAESLAVAADETADIIASELDRLLRSLPPGSNFSFMSVPDLSERGQKHLDNLGHLHQKMEHLLPTDLAATERILNMSVDHALRRLNVCVTDDIANLNPWQQALIENLNHDSAASETGIDLDAILAPNRIREDNSLTTLQQDLYQHVTASTTLDDTLQWLAVRDFLEEVEVVAGMIQKSLTDDPTLKYADIAILLPNDAAYATAVYDVFNRAGLPVSGLSVSHRQRDLGHEVVFHLLQTLRKPAPVMAMAAFVTSPLLPWTRPQGFVIAAALMRGNYQLEKLEISTTQQDDEILDLIRSGADNVSELKTILKRFPNLLGKDESLSTHRRKAATLCDTLIEKLNTAEIPWDALLSTSTPAPEKIEVGGEFSREGIAVFREHEEPWREIKTLYVLGFNDGHYPSDTRTSPVFSDTDLATLRSQGLKLDDSADVARKWRELFCRQLQTAHGNVHFLLSRRDARGKAIAPSSTLPFMAQIFAAGDEPETLICELDSDEGRSKARGLALAANVAPVLPRKHEIEDLKLDLNLLDILTDNAGKPRKQSPSSLETLMTSPLAWLLGRSGLEPNEWQPEKLDVMSKGTVAHAVFESLFAPGQPLPSEQDVEQSVPKLLYEKIVAIIPFLNRPEWRVERYHLERDILNAAHRWREVLDSIGAEVLGVEVWLQGNLNQQPIHGSADLLMELPDGKTYVVDYKKSSSKKRKERMEKGYDSQASLYRIMLQTGEGKFRSSDGTTVTIDGDREIGALYYLMNDQVALADTAGWIADSLRDFEELGADVSANALPLIRDRLIQVKQGRIMLNNEGDEKWYDKNAGVALYALDNSPLIRMFMHKDQPQGE